MKNIAIEGIVNDFLAQLKEKGILANVRYTLGMNAEIVEINIRIVSRIE